MVNHCTSKQEAKQKQKVKQRTVSLQRDGDGVHQKTECRSCRREVENNRISRLSKAQFSSSFSEVVVGIYIFVVD